MTEDLSEEEYEKSIDCGLDLAQELRALILNSKNFVNSISIFVAMTEICADVISDDCIEDFYEKILDLKDFNEEDSDKLN